MQWSQIRTLTISVGHVIDDPYTVRRLCHLFPCIERLNVSIKHVEILIAFIDAFQYLLNGSFNFEFSSEHGRSKLSFHDGLQLIKDEFTYCLDGFTVHMWIKKKVSD